jgi:hypothetical protein
MNKTVVLALFVVALPIALSAANATPSEKVSPQPDPLISANSEFLRLYAAARSYEINHCGPVIIVSSGKAVLITGKTRKEAKFIPPEYQVFKAIDHTTLAVFVALKNVVGNKLSAANISDLKSLQSYAQSSEKELSRYNLDPVTLARQKKLLSNTVDFISEVLAKATVSKEELDNFVRQQTPQLMENANASVAMELHTLDTHIQSWKQTMKPSAWNQVHVIICDEHMPRNDERYMQYFLKLFGEKQEGQHVIYQEGNFDEKKAMQLLGTHLLDKSIAEEFFGDPSRMHRDLLSDGARKYLQQKIK